MHPGVAAAWDREYERGRYVDEAPVPFVDRIISSARRARLVGEPGLYIGCGNGRNYVPLVRTGLDLSGIDVSGVAIRELAAREPSRADRLLHGDLSAVSQDASFAISSGSRCSNTATGVRLI